MSRVLIVLFMTVEGLHGIRSLRCCNFYDDRSRRHRLDFKLGALTLVRLLSDTVATCKIPMHHI